MSPLALFMLVGTVVAWAECVVWYFRRRAHDPRAGTLTAGGALSLIVILGFIAPYVAGVRFLVWGIRNGWEWIAGPVSMHARARWTRRRQIRRAHRSTVGAAVLQALPPGRTVLQLPAAPALAAQPAPPVVEGMWVWDRDLQVSRWELVDQGQAS